MNELWLALALVAGPMLLLALLWMPILHMAGWHIYEGKPKGEK